MDWAPLLRVMASFEQGQRAVRGRIQCCCKKSTKARTFGSSRRLRRVRMLNGVGGR